MQSAIEKFLYFEARLLDERRFEDWYNLFAEDGYYWVPGAPDQTDPYNSVSIFFDDKALLKTRIMRLRHPKLHSQEPQSRTCHYASNVEIDNNRGNGSEIFVHSVQLMTEFRLDKQTSFSGRCYHHLRTQKSSYEIISKRVNLINCDGIFETLTIPF